MKKLAKKIIAFFIVSFICSIVGVSASEISQEHYQKEQGNILYIAPSNQHSQAVEQRNTSSLLSMIPVYSQKFFATSNVSALLHTYLSSDYIFYSSCLIERIENTDIIYPFHVFW